MASIIHTFTCPRCNQGEFRSLAGPDGKAYCPWCGDPVTGGVPVPASSPGPAALERPAEPVTGAAEGADRELRERLAESERRREQAEAELRRELDKKQEIKKAVLAEMEQLHARLNETQVRLRQRDEERQTSVDELGRLKEIAAQQRAADLAGARGALEEREETLRRLQAELEERRKAADAARREADGLRSDLAKLKGASEAELADLRRKVAAAKDAEVLLRDLKGRIQDERPRFEKEVAALRERAANLEAELGKRDQRIRDLQLLIKTLGERLNDLTSRRF